MSEVAGKRPRDGRLRLALRLATMIRTGTLTVVLPDGSSHRVAKSPEPSATIIIKDPRAVTRLVTGGSRGLAEA
jgi:cyclopropane-fatty-acyl-phospholipid synthase